MNTKASEPTASIEVITPGMAMELLRNQAPNRHVSMNRVAAYAEDMDKSFWPLTNQGIGIDVQGRLQDGQHRLMAVVASGQPCSFVVVRGLPEQSQEVVDRGRVRSLKDKLAMEGMHGVNARVSRARAILFILHRDVLHGQYLQIQALEDWKAELDWSLEHLTKGPVCRAPIAGAWCYAARAKPEVKEFAHQYVSGEKLMAGDPLLRLRDVMVLDASGRGSHGHRAETMLKTLNALNAKLTGERGGRLYPSTVGLMAFAKAMGDASTIDKWADWRAVERNGAK